MSQPEKIAPVQGFSAGIPWSMHLRAYDAYCKENGPQPALINLEDRNCRGGFSTGELDRYIPGWREELKENTKLRADNKALLEALKAIYALFNEEPRFYLRPIDHDYRMTYADSERVDAAFIKADAALEQAGQ